MCVKLSEDIIREIGALKSTITSFDRPDVSTSLHVIPMDYGSK